MSNENKPPSESAAPEPNEPIGEANAQGPSAGHHDTPHDEVMPEGKEPPPRGWRVMAVVRWALVLVMAAIAIAAVLRAFRITGKSSTSASAEVWYCPMHPSVVQDRPGECPICGMSLVKREGAQGASSAADTGAVSHEGHRHEPTDPFVCPMHPEETGLSANDRCPICFMKLEPRGSVDAGAPDGPGGTVNAGVPGLAPIDLSFDRIQLIGMKTARATKESLVNELKTVGFVTPTEQGVAKVTTRFAGWIEGLPVAETGRKVRRGELMALVYSPQVYLAQQEYLTARSFAPVSDGGTSVGASLAPDARKRLELLGVASGDIAAIEKSGQPRKTVGVYAPATGWVIQKAAIIGQSFQPGTDLFTIADLSRVWVLADVYEHELARVKLGQAARFTTSTYPDRVFTGEVKFVYPTVDVATRTAKVRLEFTNAKTSGVTTADLELRPGMYGDVALSLPAGQSIVVPREALVDTGELQYVFVDKGNGRFEPRRVVSGTRMAEKVEIRSGVAEGEVVVTTGNFLLDSESRLRAAIEGQSAQSTSASPAPASACDAEIDKTKYPAKYDACRACEKQHAGMGTMVDDCKKAIGKPWK